MFQLNLVTPEKRLVTGQEIEEVIVPAYRGQLGILPGHAPLVSTLSTGVLQYRLKGQTQFVSVVVSWGYLEVHPDGVTVLAETAESIEEINKERALEAAKKAQAKLADPAIEFDMMDKLQRKLERATARIHAADLHNSTKH